jgi:hypothetical protein
MLSCLLPIQQQSPGRVEPVQVLADAGIGAGHGVRESRVKGLTELPCALHVFGRVRSAVQVPAETPVMGTGDHDTVTDNGALKGEVSIGQFGIGSRILMSGDLQAQGTDRGESVMGARGRAFHDLSKPLCGQLREKGSEDAIGRHVVKGGAEPVVRMQIE